MAIRQGFAFAAPLDGLKSDTVDLNVPIDAIYVGGAGDVNVMTANGGAAFFAAPPVGTIIPIRAKRLLLTGTSATLLMGLWGQ